MHRQGIFSFLHRFLTISVFHPSSYTLGTVSPFAEGKTAVAGLKLTIRLHSAYVTNVLSYISISPYVFVVWSLTKYDTIVSLP
jgi:hypothetical protein